MEPVTGPWSENSSVTPPTESAFLAGAELVHTIIPPYIFTVSALGLLFNSFVLAVFLAHKDRLTVAEVYLCNLALADFLLLCGLPFWAMNILNRFHWPYGDALCKAVNSVMILNFYTSIYTLVMISIDRFLALVKTMRARRLRRARYAKVVCVLLWVLGLLLSTPTLLHRKVKYFEELNTKACVLDYSHGSSWKLAHQILMNVAGFALPFLVIVFSSGSIVKVLSERGGSVGHYEPNDSKATVLLLAVTFLFLLCWGPFQVFTLLDTLCDLRVLDEGLWYGALDVGAQVSAYLAFLNSALNPLLYVFSGQYFRRKVSAVYRRTGHHRRGSDMTTYQRSVVSTYINRPEHIKAVVLNARDRM